MTIVVRSVKWRLISLAVSLAIFAIVYFAFIKPSNDTAKSAINNATQQLNQAVNQANKDSGGAVPVGVTNLTACLAAAGGDTGKIQACDAKFKP